MYITKGVSPGIEFDLFRQSLKLGYLGRLWFQCLDSMDSLQPTHIDDNPEDVRLPKPEGKNAKSQRIDIVQKRWLFRLYSREVICIGQ